MSFLNAIFRGLFDLLMMPFQTAPAWVSLLLVSLLTAILALLVYRRFSDQEAITAVKSQIAASFFEIRLFNDDLRAILRAQLDLLKNNGIYLLLNLKPLLWMLVPMLILMTQLQFHYGYKGLRPSESAVVTATFTEGTATADRPTVELRAPEAIAIERGPLWIPEKRALAWRLQPEERGRYELELVVGESTVTKTVVVSDRIERRSPVRHRAGFLYQLLYPAEAPIDGDLGVESIRIAYPEADVEILGIELQWLIWWLLLTIVLAFLLRNRFGVTF